MTVVKCLEQTGLFRDFLVLGVRRISQAGGGPTYKFYFFLAYMPRVVARGVWGHAPRLTITAVLTYDQAPAIKFTKWCNFIRFEGYFQSVS